MKIKGRFSKDNRSYTKTNAHDGPFILFNGDFVDFATPEMMAKCRELKRKLDAVVWAPNPMYRVSLETGRWPSGEPTTNLVTNGLFWSPDDVYIGKVSDEPVLTPYIAADAQATYEFHLFTKDWPHNIRYENPCDECRDVGNCLEKGNGCSWQEEWAK